MAYLTTFVFSEDTNQELVNQNKILHVINPQNVFRPQFVPSAFSFSVTFGLIDLDPDKKNTIRFTLNAPNENEKYVVDTGNIDLDPNHAFDRRLPIEANGFMMNMDFRNVPFRIEGKYLAKVNVNGELVGEYPVFVYGQEQI
jgi:hypothetical protein